MTARYFRKGSIPLDMDPDLGGNPEAYVEAGWTEISEAEFRPLLAAYYARQEADRLKWLKEMGDADFSQFKKIEQEFERIPRESGLVRDG
jgi:hypothetical protein